VHGKNREREGNIKLKYAHCRGVNIVILNLQRPLWEGDKEVGKISGRDEPMWIAIHKCMEAVVGFCLYSYLYLKLAKAPCLSYYLLCFLFNKIREQESRTGFAQKWGRVGKSREVDQTIYTYESKCKNDKIEEMGGKKRLTKCPEGCLLAPGMKHCD
jgi:glycosyltransferase involved in cell wall biosynthesis